MFEKTRIKLVVLNSIVFFIILNSFGVSLYFYMRYHLYSQVDKQLEDVRTHLLNEPEHHFENMMNPETEGTRQIEYLFWGTDEKIKMTLPEHTLVPRSVYPLLEKVSGSESLHTITKAGSSYRFVNIPVQYDVTIKGKKEAIEKVQLVYSLYGEQELLKHLLMVVAVGSLMSIIVAILAGFYLANSALIPIKNAWNKQSRFVGDASHELRTPLSVMKLNLERLFRHPNRTIEEESENISEAIQEINYMTKLISNLLTLARSDSDQMEINREPIRLDKILSKVFYGFEELAKLKNIAMDASIASPLEIIGDQERIRQLFVILLDNAVKYTKEAGKITVQASAKGSQVRVEIIDTGVGISKEELPFIFDRFYRGDKSRTRNFEGSGLGLAIAQWIIQSHDGKVRVKSQLGEGTEVSISFPICKE
jgi:signal transduction histidine kinase